MPESRRILVTGAGGFIGGRVVEVFHLLGTAEVRAALRRWAKGARIGRLPIEMVSCDVRDAQQVATAMHGVTHVVHCAVGDSSTTIEGTRTLLQAARSRGVRRLVYLSTVDVYGTPEGEVAETHPVTMTGRPYGDSKTQAERICREFGSDGLHVTMLRPSLVHGPFSATWTIAYAQRLQRRPWLVAEGDAAGTCNLVYVDDLVGAIMAALDAETESGEAFNINGPDRPSWNDYFHALNQAMGRPPLEIVSKSSSHARARALQPLRGFARFGAKRFEWGLKRLAQGSPVAREAMLRTEKLLRHTPAPSEFEVYSRRTSFSTDKAEKMLGYRPRFPLNEALSLTGAWLKHHGFVHDA